MNPKFKFPVRAFWGKKVSYPLKRPRALDAETYFAILQIAIVRSTLSHGKSVALQNPNSYEQLTARVIKYNKSLTVHSYFRAEPFSLTKAVLFFLTLATHTRFAPRQGHPKRPDKDAIMPQYWTLASSRSPGDIKAEAHSHRAPQRRSTYYAQAASYAVDAVILMLYYLVGVTTLAVQLLTSHAASSLRPCGSCFRRCALTTGSKITISLSRRAFAA